MMFETTSNQKFLQGGPGGGSFFKKRPPWPPEAKKLTSDLPVLGGGIGGAAFGFALDGAAEAFF